MKSHIPEILNLLSELEVLRKMYEEKDSPDIRELSRKLARKYCGLKEE